MILRVIRLRANAAERTTTVIEAADAAETLRAVKASASMLAGQLRAMVRSSVQPGDRAA